MSDVAPKAAVLPKMRKPVARKSYDQRDAIERGLATLDKDSPAHAICASSSLQRRLGAYEHRDAAAESYQWYYKRLGLTALILTSAAIMLGAVTLMAPLSTGYEAARSSMGTAAVTFNFAVLALVALIKRNALVAKWMTSRAKAERLRGMIFERLLGAAAARPGALSDALKVTNAAHVDYQLGYFTSAKTRHLRPAWLKTFAKYLAGTTFLLSVAIATLRWRPVAEYLRGHAQQTNDLLGYLQQSEGVHIQLGLSVISAGMVVALTAWELMNQDERNAKLYELSERRLSALKAGKRTEATAAAAAGDAAPVASYLRDVRAVLEADQQSWQLSPPPEDPTLAHLRKLR